MTSDYTDYLKHYASEYYDPVKAHEYYEAHKKLKGRRSTKGLNDKGLAAASYVKKQLDDERDSKINTETENTKRNIESTKERTANDIENEQQVTSQMVEQHKQKMQSSIEQLQNKLKRMNRVDKARNKEAITAEIESLRAENANMRNTLYGQLKTKKAELRKSSSEEIGSHKENLKKTKENLNTEYESKYLDELDKIKADKSNLAAPKVKKGKAKKTSSGPKKRSQVVLNVNGRKLNMYS